MLFFLNFPPFNVRQKIKKTLIGKFSIFQGPFYTRHLWILLCYLIISLQLISFFNRSFVGNVYKVHYNEGKTSNFLAITLKRLCQTNSYLSILNRLGLWSRCYWYLIHKRFIWDNWTAIFRWILSFAFFIRIDDVLYLIEFICLSYKAKTLLHILMLWRSLTDLLSLVYHEWCWFLNKLCITRGISS